MYTVSQSADRTLLEKRAVGKILDIQGLDWYKGRRGVWFVGLVLLVERSTVHVIHLHVDCLELSIVLDGRQPVLPAYQEIII